MADSRISVKNSVGLKPNKQNIITSIYRIRYLNELARIYGVSK
jgi:hypothetical protein